MAAALRRLALAGRGPVAMRIVHAAREYGAAHGAPVTLIAVRVAGDPATLAVREADEVLDVRAADADADAIAEALAAQAVDAVWVGPGLVAHPAALAERCAARGLVVVGAPAADDAPVPDGGDRRLEVPVFTDDFGGALALGVVETTVRDAGGALLAECATPALPPGDEARARASASAAALASGYHGAVTVVLAADGSAIADVVAGLAPEHAAAELTTGVDLARLLLRVACGDAVESGTPQPRGHAIQASLRADAGSGDGIVALLRLPSGPFVRVDAGVAEGDAMAGADPLIATVGAWGADRPEALARLRRALAETHVVVEGGTTNLGLLLELTAHPAVIRGELTAGELADLHAGPGAKTAPGADIALLQAAIEVAGEQALIERRRFGAFARRGRPTAEAPLSHTAELRHHGQDYRLAVSQIAPSRHRVVVDGASIDVDVEVRGPHERRLTIGRRTVRTLVSALDADLLVEVDGIPHRIARDDGGIVRNPAPAVVVSLPVAVGDEVAAGDVVAVVESMKMESTLVAPFAGRVRALLATPNVQVGAQAPLVQLEPLTHRAPRGDDVGRVVFTSADARDGGPLDSAIRLLLGYDVPVADAERAIVAAGPSVAAAEQDVLECYADIQALTRPRHDVADQDAVQRSPQEHFHAWLRTLDPETEGLPRHFADALERALEHYGIRSMARTPELEDAAYRLFVAEQRSADARAVALAILDRCLDGASADPPPGLRATLERVAQVAERRDPVVSDVARECRWRLFDGPVVAAVRAEAYADAEARIDRLVAGDAEPQRAEDLQVLVEFRYPLVTLIAERLAHAPADEGRMLLELMTRRFYRMPSLEGFGQEGDLLTATYRFDGVERHLATAFVAVEELEGAVERFAALAGALPDDAEASADLYVRWDGEAPVTAALAADLLERLRHVTLPPAVHRVVVAVAVPARGRGLGAVETFTFRPAPDGLHEDELLRGMHPMIAHRLQVWRLANFTLDRLQSAEDVYVFHGVAHQNPKDERLFALAEVRDLTPVRDEDGRLTALPEFERMYIEALEGLRGYQGHRATGRRLQWNRVLLHVWPEIDLTPAEMTGLLTRLAPAGDGLGLEMLIVRGRLREADGVVRDRVLRFFSPAGTGVLVEVDDPPTRPLEPLDESARRVVSARRRGTPHPAEVLKLLGGSFEEHDLDESGALVPVDRPIATNSASVVVGLVRNVTDRHPEGMLRVALLGDPTKALGSLAEPECRRINAALALAERLGVPLEWFALSAGAKIAMDSGTENMDWIADVLRRVIEFTQRGGELNVVVTGINVGAQPYWNAEATMLMHTRGILVMTPESAMVLTGKQALDYSGGVSAEDNFGIGGFERIMGPNGQAQYWAPDLDGACRLLLRYYDHAYVVPGERFPRRAHTGDPRERDVRPAPHHAPGSDLQTVGAIFSDATNPGRKKPFDIRSVMRAAIDADHEPLERWGAMRGAESAVVWDARLGGWPVALLGLESRPLTRFGAVPADGPDRWTSGTLFPRSSKKIARTINSVGGRRPLVVLANLSGFDGSPESMREWQLEFGAEIGRAVVNFDGPIVFCVVSRYHGGAFVVFSRRLNEHFEAVALEGAHASVIGGAPAAAVVFARDVDAATRADPRVAALDERLAAAEGPERQRLRAERAELWAAVRSEQLGALADRFDSIHSVERAVEMGSVDRIIDPATLRPYLIDAIERGMGRFTA